MKKYTIGIIGNPNSGKTTIFNALTGSHQRVGNWPGVTVERFSGYFELKDHAVEIVDLPGIYSLSTFSKDPAIDELIATEYMLTEAPDLIVNVVDANNLERNLYLTTQLLELNTPIILAINMLDIAKKRGRKIDLSHLAQELGCPVVAVVGNKKQGIDKLKEEIIRTVDSPKITNLHVQFPPAITATIDKLANMLKSRQAYFQAIRLLENDQSVKKELEQDELTKALRIKQGLKENLADDVDIIIADCRYSLIHGLTQKIVIDTKAITTTVTAAIDKVVLNRIFGIPIFLFTMYLMFYFSVVIGGAFQDFFQIGSNALFVHGLSNILIQLHTPEWLRTVITTGLGKGINTTVTFIPVLTTMFLALALLEATGYMSRAGFVVDRLMCAIGLPGKSFVPMLIGFGCNVPAIMAARTLENRRDRILTILMTPFMSCSARLAIYAVFTAAFFPIGGQNIVFILYLTGILTAVITGLILRKTILAGKQSFLVMELPPYHLPSFRNILTQTWCRLKSFIYKAGKIIIPVCIVLSLLTVISVEKKSTLTYAGRTAATIFSPMGIDNGNWPAAVGLVTGIMAKEVVVGTLNTLYAKDSNKLPHHTKTQQQFNISQELHAAVLSIKENLKHIFTKAHAPARQQIYGQMYKRFGGKIAAFAYLLFVLLYFPCLPVIATIFKELGWRWTLFSVSWNTAVAYAVATIFYQAATFHLNPGFSSAWIAGTIIMLFIVVLIMRHSNKLNKRGDKI